VRRRARDLQPRGEALLASALVAVLYVATLARNHAENEDSLNFANRIRSGETGTFFEGPHLVFDWIGWLWYLPLRTLGITKDAVAAVSVLDALLAGAAVGLLWLLMRRLGGGRLAAFAACGVLTTSYAYWRNGNDVEVFALSALFVVGSLLALQRALEAPSPRAFAVVGVVMGLATVAYLPNLLLVFGGAAALWLTRAAGGLGRRALALLAGGAAICVPLYLIAFADRGLWSYSEIHDWATQSSGAKATTGHLDLGALKKGVVGGGRSFVGGHFMLALASVRRFVLAHYPGKTLRPDSFLVADMSHALVGFLALLAGIVVVFSVLLLARWLHPRLAPELRRLAFVLLAILVPVAILDFWWDPLNMKLWGNLWILVCVLVALPLVGRTTRGDAIVVSGLVASLFAVNLIGSIVPQMRDSRDYWRVRGAWYAEHAQKGDLILANGYVWTAYLEHLTPADVVDVQTFYNRAPDAAIARQELIDLLARSRAPHVYVSQETLHPFADAPAGCLEEAFTCESAATTRYLLLPRAHVVASTPMEKVWELRR
jgi:hypothetical protein